MKPTFNDMLTSAKIDSEKVLVLRHRPVEATLREVLPWLAVERPHLYNAYQQTQGEKVEKRMKKAQYVASFIGMKPKQAVFVGLYKMVGWDVLSHSECVARPETSQLISYGAIGFAGPHERDGVHWFDLQLVIDFNIDWQGRLVVSWPGKELNWHQFASRNAFPIHAVHEESVLVRRMPRWQKLTLPWNKLKAMPYSWRTVLQEWRGIYYIFDRSDGKGYVGAAYGAENILQRWLNYATTGHGGNKLLKTRDPENFEFSILQRVSPDMEAAEVTQTESSWKDRLHTRAPVGLNDN